MKKKLIEIKRKTMISPPNKYLNTLDSVVFIFGH